MEWLPEDWRRARAVVAHPDDLEYGAASAIARWTAQGKDVVYLLATRGEAGIASMPPHEVGPLREAEQRASAAIVGVSVVEFLDHVDGLLEASPALRRDLAAAIRRHRPEVVVSINFRDGFGPGSWNHVDHRNLGIALLDAARDAANPWLFPELRAAGLEPWDGVRMACFGGSPLATHAVDVSDSIDRGIASLAAHAAYLEALGSGAMADPEAFLRPMAARTGQAMGVAYATSFEVIQL